MGGLRYQRGLFASALGGEGRQQRGKRVATGGLAASLRCAAWRLRGLPRGR